MKFNKHNNLEGLHAPFSASQSHWLRYDEEKIINTYINKKSAEMGTRLHEWAAETIELGKLTGIKMPKSKKTLYSYINDAIGFGMSTEVVLFYSQYFFGTADAISFKNNFLRIHDLKTGKVGKIEDHLEQLLVYVALFCLEYKIKPGELKGCECRVYKMDDIFIANPTPEDILPIMDKIIHLNKILEKLNEEV